MALNFNISTCPAPFLDESAYPYAKGYRPGRVCAAVSDDLACCLPCPTQTWVFSDSFKRKMTIAYWFNVPALACQVFLLLSFLILPKEKSHGHYLGIGLCISLIMLELAFIVPLGVEPNMCYDAVTPADMYSDLTCAWSGAFLEFGAMAGCTWILLRSLWIFLRVCIDVKHLPAFLWISQIFGWGVPALFLAVAVPVSGLSYRIGNTCIPNERYSFVTWFGWLLAFGGLAAVIQLSTTGFCLWLYARHFWHHESSDGSDKGVMGFSGEGQRRPSVVLSKRLARRRVRKAVKLQWRSIVLSFFVVVDSVYFGTVYVAATKAAQDSQTAANLLPLEQWAACLVFNAGNKDACLKYADVLGLNENVTVSSYFMAAFIGIVTFLIKIRWSVFVGWYELFRYGWHAELKSRKRSVGRSLASSDMTDRRKRSSVRRSWASSAMQAAMQEKRPRPLTLDATGILPEPLDSPRTVSFPEAGSVTQRHDTTNWFDSDVEDEEVKSSRRLEDEDAAE